LRKITAILFLIITCIGYSGYHFIYVYKIRCAKEEAALKVLRQIPDNKLTKIEQDKSLHWNGDDELWYDNQMFDVVKRVFQNGKEYLMCISDSDEADALKKMANFAYSGTTSDSNGKDVTKLKSGFQDLYCNQFFLGNESSKISSEITYSYTYSSQLSEMSSTILLPPPKF
jgi:hypothetical protein